MNAPIDISMYGPNAETLAAMREGEIGLDEDISLNQLWDISDEDD